MSIIATTSDPIPYVVFGGMILAFVSIIIFTQRYHKKRRAALLQVANDLGMQFSPEKCDPTNFGFAPMKFFNRGRSRQITNRISGPMADTTGMLFDYQFTSGSGKNSNTHKQTVAAFHIPSANLPQFCCKPEHFFHRIADKFGFPDIDFPDHPLFSKKYHLSGDQESAVRTLFTDHTIQLLESRPDKHWNIHGNNEWLILFRAQKTLKPEEWTSFLLEAIEVMNSMTLSALRS